MRRSVRWVSSPAPITLADGIPADSDTTLTMDILESVFEQHEWKVAGTTAMFREALISADILNRYGPPEIVSPEERDAPGWD